MAEPADPELIEAVVGVQQVILDSVTVLLVLGCVFLAVKLFSTFANLR